MEHAAYDVDILDQRGQVIGTKKRQDIDKTTDIYHTVYCLFITPEGRLVLTRIPERSDLPNLYTQRLGFPGATIRRTHEDSSTAIKRLGIREFFIDNATFHFIGDMTIQGSPVKKFISLFYLITEPLTTYSTADVGGLVQYTTKEIETKLCTTPKEFTPQFAQAWRKWRYALPI